MDPQNVKELRTLIEGSKYGDRDAFHEIFERLSNRVFAYALSRTINRDDAMDIAQESFIDLWKGLKKFKYRSDEEFLGFLFAITKRKIFWHLKFRKSHLPLEEKIVKENYELEVGDYQPLFMSINALASKYQDVLKLRYWSDMTFRGIAATLNIKETTAKVRHHRALKELQVKLDNNPKLL